jgi:ATP-dependent Clp protease ATP-binding subunit ClpA
MIDPGQLTEKATLTIKQSIDRAKELNHSEVEPLHLLDSMVKTKMELCQDFSDAGNTPIFRNSKDYTGTIEETKARKQTC